MIEMNQTKTRQQRDKINALAPQYLDMVDDVDDVGYEVDRQIGQLDDINEDLYDYGSELNVQDGLIGEVETDSTCGNWAKILCCRCFKFCCLSTEDAFNVEEELAKRKRVRKAQFVRTSRIAYNKPVELTGRDNAFKEACDELKWAAEDLYAVNQEERKKVKQVGANVKHNVIRTRKHNERMEKLAYW